VFHHELLWWETMVTPLRSVEKLNLRTLEARAFNGFVFFRTCQHDSVIPRIRDSFTTRHCSPMTPRKVREGRQSVCPGGWLREAPRLIALL
jgi:hypothetical protein